VKKKKKNRAQKHDLKIDKEKKNKRRSYPLQDDYFNHNFFFSGMQRKHATVHNFSLVKKISISCYSARLHDGKKLGTCAS